MLMAMAYQIDAGDLKPLAANTTWCFSLTSQDCPNETTWYMLTVYTWDSNMDMSQQSVSFKTGTVLP